MTGMIVVEDKKALVFQADNPEEISSLIPSARVSGSTIIVPHRHEEVMVLRNVGVAAPAPIMYHYKWPGKFTPYEHQRHTAAFLTMNKRGLVLNDIGTGKTQSALWAADYLMECGIIRKVLVVSPLSTLERVWGDAIFSNFPSREYVVLHGTAEKRKRLAQQDVDFYIVNHDGFAIVAELLKGVVDLIIVDEAAVLRNPGTDRFKSVRRYMTENPDTRLWLMTGTPTPNEPTDAWALAKLIGNTSLDATYTGFRDRVMMKHGKWRWSPRPDSPDIVAKVLQPSIRFTRDDCLDLPETVFMTKEAPLSKEQSKYYKDMVKHLIAEAATGAITAANEAVKAQKLIQIACGVAYDEFGNPIEMDCSPRIGVLHECIEEANGKVIVFVPLTGVLRMLERELSKKYTVSVINGEVPAQARSEIFRAFQSDPKPEILLAHPATMAHGLTLTAAKAIIWYGPITSNEQYTQANGRVERIGKTKSSIVFHIEGTDLERRVFSRLRNKQKLQGVLLDILEGE